MAGKSKTVNGESSALLGEPILTGKVKWSYGSGIVAMAIYGSIRSLFTTPFLLETANLNAMVVGFILLSSNIFDAFTDPMMGWISDRTTSVWGRRRPYILGGAIPLALSYIALWLVPPFGDTGLYIYYTVAILSYELFTTIVGVPYAALAQDLTPDHHERTELQVARGYVFGIGAFMGTIIHGLLIVIFGEDNQEGYTYSAVFFGLLAIPTLYVTFANCKERPEAATSSMPFMDGLKIAWNNRPYMILLTTACFGGMVLEFIASNTVLYLKYVLYEDEEDWLEVILVLFAASAMIGIWMYGELSKKYGKKRTYIALLVLSAFLQIPVYWCRDGDIYWYLLLLFPRSLGSYAGPVIHLSMLMDVVDEDELITGNRREGIFMAGQVFFQKLCVAVALGGSNFILDAVGYKNPNEDYDYADDVQNKDVTEALSLMNSLIPFALVCLSLIAVQFYPIDQERADKNRIALEQARLEYNANVTF